ncbi:MAG: hypothetical protein AAF573_05175 [Bacteroidota bacterium]
MLLDFWISHPKNTKKEVAFEHVFPNKKFTSKEWNLLTSRLFKLGEKYLAVREMLDNPVQQKTFSSKGFRKKKMVSHYTTNFLEQRKLLQNQKLRNEEWLQQYFYTELDYYDYIASHNRKQRTNLQEVTDTLDAYYLANKFKIACLAIARQNINQEQYDIKLLHHALRSVEENKTLLDAPAVKVYYYCYQAITQSADERWFPLLRKAMQENQSCFPPSEQRDIFMLATNYCIRQLNTGKQNFMRETFELYRISLDAGYLLEDGIMPESTFGNIATLAIRLQEFEWTKQFIYENQKFLKPVFQAPLYYFALGKLYYAKGQYQESLQHLVQVQTKASFLLIGTKVLQLKIYFEQKELDALDSLLDSFRVYLQRQKALGYHKKNYEFLVYYVKRLLEFPAKSPEEQLAFKNEVLSNTSFTEKDWVLAQLENTAKNF